MARYSKDVPYLELRLIMCGQVGYVLVDDVILGPPSEMDGAIRHTGMSRKRVTDPMVSERTKESMDQERELPLALRAAYMALHRCTEAKFASHGVTADQFVLLLALEETGTLTQRELADRISSDPSTVRAMLVLLEKNGFVRRASHPTDSRAKTVELTATGKRTLRKLWKVGQSIRDDMYGAITPKEAEILIRLLRLIPNSLSKEKTLV